MSSLRKDNSKMGNMESMETLKENWEKKKNASDAKLMPGGGQAVTQPAL